MTLTDGAFEIVGLSEGTGLVDGASLLADFLELLLLLLQPPPFPFPFPPQEGMVEGMTEGKSEGILEVEGAWLREGWPEGATLSEGASEMEGRKLGVSEGTVEGKLLGISEGKTEGDEVFLAFFSFLFAIILACFLKRRSAMTLVGAPIKARIVNKAWNFIFACLLVS
jgi:hypothetical protein